MAYRDRTITDDVLEAIQRGIDINVIRELGVLHDHLMSAASADYGEHDYQQAQEIARELKLKGKVADYDVFDACHSCIRYRLTGHRKMKIKITDLS